jgi:integrase
MPAKRRRVDIKEMTDDEVRSLIAEASRRERWMPGGFSARRARWTAMRERGEAELARRSHGFVQPS